VARIHELLNQLRGTNPSLANEIEQEYDLVAGRRAFGLNFERHAPEAVELPGRRIRLGDKVRILPPRGKARAVANRELYRVIRIERLGEERFAHLGPVSEPMSGVEVSDAVIAPFDELVVVAESRDPIYPGLDSRGKIEKGGASPFHAVINGENLHVLQTLRFTHRGKVDCIYIDPPYNTGARDWKYNNDYVEADNLYRHSKWLAFMERRLRLAAELLSVSGVLIVTIDEHEVHRLGLLLGQLLPNFTQQLVTIVTNPKGVTQGYLSRVEEYAIFCFAPEARVVSVPDDLLTHRESRGTSEEPERPRWKGLLRSGDEASRADRENMFYPVWLDPNTRRLDHAGPPLPLEVHPEMGQVIDGLVAAWPIRQDGTQGRWGVGADTLNELIEMGLASCGSFNKKRRTWGISYLSAQLREDLQDGKLEVLEYDSTTGVADVAFTGGATRRARTVWHRTSHDAGAYGTDMLGDLLGASRTFPFPKSLYAVEDSVRIVVGEKKDAVVLDFFSGSGTTAHAVMRLNRQDGGKRRSISVTNNEVSADEQSAFREMGLRPGDPEWEQWGIYEYITKPRIQAAITGKTPDGNPVEGDYKFTDPFPMADGLEENVEFFALTYEAPLRVQSNREFERISAFLWLRAGSQGRRIGALTEGWDVAETYGVLADLDHTDDFIAATIMNPDAKLAFIVTDEDRLFEAVVRDLPVGVEPVRMYEAYLRNFEIDAMRSVR
jgi:adenine-specific DNA-methyltransferase